MSQNLGSVSGLLLVTRVAQTLKSPAKFARSLKTDFVLIKVIEFVASGLEFFWKSLNACHEATEHLLLAIFYTERWQGGRGSHGHESRKVCFVLKSRF